MLVASAVGVVVVVVVVASAVGVVVVPAVVVVVEANTLDPSSTKDAPGISAHSTLEVISVKFVQLVIFRPLVNQA